MASRKAAVNISNMGYFGYANKFPKKEKKPGRAESGWNPYNRLWQTVPEN